MKYILIVIFLSLALSSKAQELRAPNLSVGLASLEGSSLFMLPALGNYSDTFRFNNFTLPEIDVYGEKAALKEQSINMQAIGQMAAHEKRSNIVQMQFSSQQLDHLKSDVSLHYGSQANFKHRTNDDLNYLGNGRTSDGGIRNEVYKDDSQPFINPYYGIYNRPYYRQHSNSNDNRVHFYINR